MYKTCWRFEDFTDDRIQANIFFIYTILTSSFYNCAEIKSDFMKSIWIQFMFVSHLVAVIIFIKSC